MERTIVERPWIAQYEFEIPSPPAQTLDFRSRIDSYAARSYLNHRLFGKGAEGSKHLIFYLSAEKKLTCVVKPVVPTRELTECEGLGLRRGTASHRDCRKESRSE